MPLTRCAARSLCAAALAAAACSSATGAAVCSASATPMVYGGYDPLYATALQVNATVTVSCAVAIGPLAAIPYSVALGTSATTGTMGRALAGPLGARLQYNLYTTASYGTVWGDGTSGTLAVSGTVTPLSLGVPVLGNHTVYGKVPALQTVRAGAYVDSILVTVNY